jgi:hypothetical protein
MRNMPGFMPANYDSEPDMFGNNIVAIFPKGAKGIALAEHKDETGKIWWFVIMGREPLPKTKISNNSSNFPIRQLSGWMSNDYLKRLDL